MKMDDSKTVGDLKQELSEQTKISKKEMCLLFAGTSLSDGATLKASGITEGSSVHFVIKMRCSVLPDIIEYAVRRGVYTNWLSSYRNNVNLLRYRHEPETPEYAEELERLQNEWWNGLRDDQRDIILSDFKSRGTR
jgi:hypothetical protein